MEYHTYRDKNDISRWLNSHKIRNFQIDIVGNVYLNENVDLRNWGLEYIPVKIIFIQGNFDVSQNRLKTLMNFPTAIYGDLDISNNDLESLEGSPVIVDGDYLCYHNRLKSLKDISTKINGDLDVSWNSLSSLQYCPKEGIKKLDCSHNFINSLEPLLTVSMKPYNINYRYNNELSQSEIDSFWSFHLNKHPEYLDFIDMYHKVSTDLVMRFCYMKNRIVSLYDGDVYDVPDSEVINFLKNKKFIEFSPKYNEWIVTKEHIDDVEYYIKRLSKIY